VKINKIIIILILIIFGFIGCGLNYDKNSGEISNINSKQLTEKEKLDDFEYMYIILKENYPFFEVNKRINGVDWLARKDDYISRIKATPNDESFFSTLNVILSDLNNGHTGMLDKNFYLYFKSVFEKNSKIDGAWLEQVNNPKTVGRYSSMQGKESSNYSSESIIPNNVNTKDLEKGKIAYLAIHSFNTFNIDEDMKIIRPYLEGIKNYNALIIDIRGNGGGDDEYWSKNIVPMLINKPLDEKQYIAYRGGDFLEQFIKNRIGGGYEKLEPISSIYEENLKCLPPELKEDFKYYFECLNHYEPENSIGYKGKIYLLIDDGVFSASEAFAIFAKSTGFATLVGNRTSGDGIGWDPAVCALPNSGYVFRFTQEMGLVSDGACNFEEKTEPDIKVSYERSSNDQAIQAVLKLVD